MPAVHGASRTVLLAAMSVVLVAVSGCQASPATPTIAPVAPSTRPSELDTSGLAVARASFCSRLEPAAVSDALGAEAESSASYDNGDTARLARGVKDVAHEYACAWRSDGRTVRTWVFAPPVTPARARELVGLARAGPGCAPVQGSPAMGRPSVALLCTNGPVVTASYRGLFGDAWLACSLTWPAAGLDRADLVERTGRWCVQAVEAARAR